MFCFISMLMIVKIMFYKLKSSEVPFRKITKLYTNVFLRTFKRYNSKY